MNAEAERHIKALDSLIAIHHADTGQEAVKALAGIIRNLEAEAATATAKLETAQAQAADLGDEAIRRGVEIQRLASVRDSLNHQLFASEERNKIQAEYLDKLRKAIGSNDWHDLDKLVEDVRALKNDRDALEQGRDAWRTRTQALERLRDSLQSQPQPPNSYLAKEVERLQAEAVAKDHQIETLKRELEKERSLHRKLENVTEVRVSPSEDQTSPFPMTAMEIQKGYNEEAWKHEPELRLARAKRDAYREELESAHDKIKKLEKAEQELDFFRKQAEALLTERNTARAEANSLRAERDRYAKLIDRL